LSKILSNIRFDESVLPLEQLVVYRRLLRLFDGHFDNLCVEDFGRYWEVSFHFVPSRAYNMSQSTMRKRRKSDLQMVYSFTVHHDNAATVQVPVDFHNEEQIQELKRNITDYFRWTQQEALSG
jgi:hypothetical protein